MALIATLRFEECRTIVLYDEGNAFNSICSHRFLPALAEIVSSVIPYAATVYTRDSRHYCSC